MSEEEKKLFLLTQLNTRINRDFNDKSEHHIKQSK